MIKFIDLKTGNTFSGEPPYVFWFPGGLGVNMIYSLPICFACDKEIVEIKLPKNLVFKLIYLPIDRQAVLSKEVINDVSYTNLTDLCSEYNRNGLIKSKGIFYEGVYLHVFYIVALSNQEGEFLEYFDINSELFKVGADFYTENESLYINLSNNGQNIPVEIQKALYASNVHEDKTDNIILNRKWKELLSNFWDVIANKGSYKSLINSLNWFGYNKDLLSIFEVWKHIENDKEILELRSLLEILGNKYFETLNGFAKTTYIAIHLALDKPSIDPINLEELYDSEKNPLMEKIPGGWNYNETDNKPVVKLKNLSEAWSYNDLCLKLSMLGKFYETYFMPIHLNLIHCTIENIVFTNTFKIHAFSSKNRYDYLYNTEAIKCNVKNGQVFVLKPVHAEAGDKTVFNKPLTLIKDTDGNMSYDDAIPLGVDKVSYLSHDSNNYADYNVGESRSSLSSFLSQYYNEIGVIVPFQINIKLEQNDFIKKSMIFYNNGKTWDKFADYKIFKSFGNKFNIKFNLLCTKEQNYDIRLQFESAGGRIYTHRVCFNVIDISSVTLRVYKICNIKTPSLNNKNNIKRYWLGRQTNIFENNKFYILYIPANYTNPLTEHWNGVALNNALIIKKDNKYNGKLLQYIKDNYFLQSLSKEGEEYITCTSKLFGFKPDKNIIKLLSVISNKNIFVPDFHELVPLGESEYKTMKDFIITENDTLCVIPELKFGKYIKDVEWEYINVSKLIPKSIKKGRSEDVTIISPLTKKALDPGYYDIIFRYKLVDGETREMILKSAFRKI